MGMRNEELNWGRVSGQTGNREPRVIANPCRGRCSHRPANPAPPRTPAGGPWPSPTNVENDAADREVRSVKFVRRGGIHPARATLCRRERPAGGYRIRPYNGFSAGRVSGLPVWLVVAGRHVGEGHAPPANPAPETCGFPGICGTYKTTVGRDALIPPHPAPPRTPAGGNKSLPYEPRQGPLPTGKPRTPRRKHAAFPVYAEPIKRP